MPGLILNHPDKWKKALGIGPGVRMLDFNVQPEPRPLLQAEVGFPPGIWNLMDLGSGNPHCSLRQKEKCRPYLHLSEHLPLSWTKWEKLIKSLKPEIMTICKVCVDRFVRPLLSTIINAQCQEHGLNGNDSSCGTIMQVIKQTNCPPWFKMKIACLSGILLH